VSGDQGGQSRVEGAGAGGWHGRRRGFDQQQDLLRRGGMGRLFSGVRAPSTLGIFVRAFTFGHVRQLDAVDSRFLPAGRAGAHPGRARSGWCGWTSTTLSSRPMATP